MRILTFATALLAPSLLSAQALPRDVAAERTEYVRWLAQDPASPARAIAMLRIPAGGITLGPQPADVPVDSAPRATLMERSGQVVLAGWGPERTLPRGRMTAVRGHRFAPFGATGQTSVVIYRDGMPGKRPVYFPYSQAARQSVTLTPATPKERRILAPDGTTVAATEVGTVSVTFAGTTTPLHVMRVGAGEEESRLLINFRDGTTDAGTYPAGRFVELIPAGGDRYTLDLNRAFNPYCAYSTVFPCPIPWAGNVIPSRVEAGERYPPAETP